MSFHDVKVVRQALLGELAGFDAQLAEVLGDNVEGAPLEITTSSDRTASSAEIDAMLADALGDPQLEPEELQDESVDKRPELDVDAEFTRARAVEERRRALGRLGGIITGQYDITRLVVIGPDDQLEARDMTVTNAKLIAVTQLAEELDFVPAPHIYDDSVFNPRHNNYMFPLGLQTMKDREVAFFYKSARTMYKSEAGRQVGRIASISPFVERTGEGPDKLPVFITQWHSLIAVAADKRGNLNKPQDESFVDEIIKKTPLVIKRYRRYLQSVAAA